MNFKTRLLLYNILIILISSVLIIFVLCYMNKKTSDTLYNISNITIDENTYAVKKILTSNIPKQLMDINLRRFNYTLSIYEDGKVIYGEKNKSLTKLLEKYHFKNKTTKTFFIDNKTTVMSVYNNYVFFAVCNKENIAKFLFYDSTPYQYLITTFILIVLISLLVILILAIFCSNNILKKVMKPVNLLIDGAERIQNGDFNQKIIYENDDEFKTVIDNFNEMQESLKEKTEKNKSYERARKEMINGISHDLRTPLTVVKGNIKGIKDKIAVTEEKKEKYLEIAYNRVMDIENLLNQLFDTFNYESDKIVLNKERTNISSFIEDTIKSNENVINNVIKANIVLLDKKTDVYIDKIQFKRVFDNLINNTIKHNKEQENLNINIKVWTENKNVKISFQDNGKGVNDNHLNLIFNEFYKEDKSRNHDKTSVGLGLFIVKKIIEGHDGTIIAKNKGGLYFEITIEGVNLNG